jgi:hypothetical protein
MMVVVHARNILLFVYADKGILGKFFTNYLYLLGHECRPIISPCPYATVHGRVIFTDAFACAASTTALLAGAFACVVWASAKATFPWTFASAPTTFILRDHGGEGFRLVLHAHQIENPTLVSYRHLYRS